MELVGACIVIVDFFFFKQKTAYEMRISDWSSDVCSSDLVFDLVRGPASTMADQTRNAWLYDRDGRAIIHVNMPAKDEDIPAIGARGRMDHVAFDCRDPDAMEARLRSEEHTSELQSLMRISYAVFCLKKKKHNLMTAQNI